MVLRKIFALLILLLITTGLAQAQFFGLKGGIQQTNVVTDVGSNTFGTETGFTVGAFLNIPLPAGFSVLAEGLFAQKIITQQNLQLAQGQQANPDVALELGYIEIPILLAYTFRREKVVRPRVYGGPVIGVIVDETVDLKGKALGDILDEAFLLTSDAFDDREQGWMVGAGTTIDLSSSGLVELQLLLDVRYTTGISTLSEDFAGNPLAERIKIGAFTLMLGLGF